MKIGKSTVRHYALCAAIMLAAVGASAVTVYDIGKAFNESGHNSNEFGVWSLLLDNGQATGGVIPFENASESVDGDLKGISAATGGKSPWIRVNTGDKPVATDGEPVMPDELVVHPALPENNSFSADCLRFTAPEAGWYSAFVSAHDVQSGASTNDNSGVLVLVKANDSILVRQVVSIEDYAASNPTHRFDFQMPVRHLDAGDKIEVIVGNVNSVGSDVNSSDATGLKFIVTKEDEGLFYDSGIAMTNNVKTFQVNPRGSIDEGTWYFLVPNVPADVDFATWAPANYNNSLGMNSIKAFATRSDASYQRGFASNSTGSSPYAVVNESSSESIASSGTPSRSGYIAPCELHMHPNGSVSKSWVSARFRPPEFGHYSASIVVRDVLRGDVYNSADGVYVYLLTTYGVLTNAYVSAESYSSTAHFSFDGLVLAPGEPVDIVIYTGGNANSDATAVSAIFRREPGNAYDAGKSFFYDHKNGGEGTARAFYDVLGDGATWQLGAKTNAWCGEQFFTFADDRVVENMLWKQGRFASYTEFPFFLMATNGAAQTVGTFGVQAALFSVTPREFVALVNEPGYQSSSPTIRGIVPTSGVYRVRSYVRDLNNAVPDNRVDGVRASIAVDDLVVASKVVQSDTGKGGQPEAVVAADYLWIDEGARIEFVVDPIANRTNDQTGVTACYERIGDEAGRVINIDAAAAVVGWGSAYVGVGREGYADWNKWNAIPVPEEPPAEIVAKNCREADGETRRNVTFSIRRASGSPVVKGTAASGQGHDKSIYNSWIYSSGASDAYTFTLSRLKRNEKFRIYFYSAKGKDAGNGVFTVNGVTKAADEPWDHQGVKMLASFEATSDDSGRITGSFSAADSNGGALNGVTVVGEFPAYVPTKLLVIMR